MFRLTLAVSTISLFSTKSNGWWLVLLYPRETSEQLCVTSITLQICYLKVIPINLSNYKCSCEGHVS